MDELRQQVYSFHEPRWSPRMQNCCVRRQVFDGIRDRFGRLFVGPCPDYAFLALTLDSLESFTAIHRPLHIAGRSSGSVGAVQATTMGEEAERFLEESGGEEVLQAGPCGVPVLANFIAATLKNANNLIARSGGDPPSIDVIACFARAARNIKRIEGYTGPRPDLRESLQKAAQRIGEEAEQVVASALDVVPGRPGLLSMWLDSVIRRSELLSRWEVSVRFGGDPARARRPYRVEQGVFIGRDQVFVHGDLLGMSNILEMTVLVDRLFDEFAIPLLRAT